MTTIKDIKTVFHIDDLLAYHGMICDTRFDHWESIKCPFHFDNTPSASVNLSADRFVCHGCGVKGDIIDIVKEVEQLDTRGAMVWIEQHLGSWNEV